MDFESHDGYLRALPSLLLTYPRWIRCKPMWSCSEETHPWRCAEGQVHGHGLPLGSLINNKDQRSGRNTPGSAGRSAGISSSHTDGGLTCSRPSTTGQKPGGLCLGLWHLRPLMLLRPGHHAVRSPGGRRDFWAQVQLIAACSAPAQAPELGVRSGQGTAASQPSQALSKVLTHKPVKGTKWRLP